MTDQKEKILSYTKEMFPQHGFYKTKMDDIAKELGMSKKTIYKLFPTKQELVEETIRGLLNDLEGAVNNTIAVEEHPIKRLLKSFEVISKRLMSFSDQYVTDIKEHMSYMWLEVDTQRKRIFMNTYLNTYHKGVEEGYFIPLPPVLLNGMILTLLTNMINLKFLSEHNLQPYAVYKFVLEFILRGTLTKKGTDYLKKLDEGIMP